LCFPGAERGEDIFYSGKVSIYLRRNVFFPLIPVIVEEQLEAEHYLNTEIKIISVNDLDGDLPAEPYGRNLLREKTFNSELNSLVNKIFSNEKMSEKPLEIYDEYNPTEKNSLLLECEKLIYQLKHSEDLNTVSSCYNPFDTDIDVYDDIDDTADYVKAGLLQCGYSKYQILKYNFNDKAYRSDINLLNESYSTGMYFSNNDLLLARIKDHAEGFILNPDLINSDPYFSKKFLNRDSDDINQHSFYIAKISSFFNDFGNVNIHENKISRFEKFLSPLILIELDYADNIKPEDIFQEVKKTAALPLMLYFLKNRIQFSINNYSYEDTLIMIELFIKSSVNSKLKSYIITLEDYSTKVNIFILKFVLSKIRKILKRNSLTLQISINKAVFITAEQEIGDISNVIDRVNSGNQLITLTPIDYDEYLNSKEFVNLFL